METPKAAAMYDVMVSAFGDSIWTPGDGYPLNHTRAELLARGQRARMFFVRCVLRVCVVVGGGVRVGWGGRG